MSSPYFDLSGQVALVTGASRGLGQYFGRALARAGADLVITSRALGSLQDFKEQIEELGREAVPVELDVRSFDSIQSMAESAWQAYGKIDILVNNAGTHRRAPFLEIPLDLWRRVIDIDLTGPFIVSQAVARHMAERGYGKIINTTSVNAKRAQPNLAHYAAAKGGLHMLSRGMALDLAQYGIRVNSIAPGLVRTALTQPVMDDPEFLASRLALMPLGGPLEPSDFAGAAVFLASSASDMITGATITVDAGMTVW